MIASRPAIIKGVCATVLALVVLQLGWAYWDGQSLSSLPFRHTQHGPTKEHEEVLNVVCHGNPKCFPSRRSFSHFSVANSTEFCREFVSEPIQPPPRLATVTAHFGNPQRHYQRALGTHVLHNAVQGTKLHVLSTKLIDDLWNKPAFLLELLLLEMEKPVSERLEWMFWVDRDTIILDNCRSPLSFLPAPLPRNNETEIDPADDIHFLATKDWNGLNNGVFLMRVDRWNIDLFTAILAHRYYRPEVDLPFTEQSAMGLLLNEPKFRDGVVWAPQYWFNTYPRSLEKEDFRPTKLDPTAQGYHARRGDFLVHFAGKGQRDQAMAPWLNISEAATTGWATEPKERTLDSDMAEFWQKWRASKTIVTSP
jgi:mannan polymerase II complex MNN10 subunit